MLPLFQHEVGSGFSAGALSRIKRMDAIRGLGGLPINTNQLQNHASDVAHAKNTWPASRATQGLVISLAATVLRWDG